MQKAVSEFYQLSQTGAAMGLQSDRAPGQILDTIRLPKMLKNLQLPSAQDEEKSNLKKRKSSLQVDNARVNFAELGQQFLTPQMSKNAGKRFELKRSASTRG